MTHSEKNPTASWATIPNALCLFRILGSGGLVVLALSGHEWPAFYLVIALLLSDWLDGKLAVALNQRSVLGSTIDTVADVSMYAASTFAVLQLYPHVIYENLGWIGMVVATYLLTVVVCLAKFGRWPSYHTRSAKASWLLTAIAVLSVFLGFADWPVRVATSLVAAGNLETTAITLIMPHYKTDVSSVLHALRIQREQ